MSDDFGAKGKGKGKGKGSPHGGKGHLLEKTRLSAEKFTGTVVCWKGRFGFVKPDETIEHEKAHLHNGNLFVRVGDIEGAEQLDVGAPVEFHINEDESGLGAEEVVQLGDAPEGAGKAAGKAAGKGKADAWGAGPAAKGGKAGKKGWSLASGGAVYADDGWGADAWEEGPVAKGGKAGKKGWSLASGGAVYGGGDEKGVFSSIGKMGAKGKGMEKGKGKGGKDSGGGKGHLLPRTRITAEKFTGTVKSWKGKYGWVTPAEPIEHEKASRHGGSLFVSKDDIEGGVDRLEEGQVVEFHVWEDSSGLGVDEVAVM